MGRITGGYSLHAEEKPELCHAGDGTNRCGPWRVVDCCKVAGPDRDIEECGRCGKQRGCACSFDEEYS